MSHQRLFPTYPVPHVGHFVPTGRKPPVILPVPNWNVVGSWVAKEDPIPLKSKSMQKACVHEYGKGKIVTLTLKWRYNGGEAIRASASADLDGDGIVEVVCCPYGRVLCLSGVDGSYKWHYDIPADVKYMTVYDIDGDGKMEVIVTCGDGYCWCFNYDGTLKWKYFAAWAASTSTQAVYDVNDDGWPEIVFASDEDIIALKYDGTLLWSNPDMTPRPRGLAVADLDGDGIGEVIVAGGDYLFCVDGKDGSTIWTYSTGYTWASAAIFDVDGDGLLEALGSSDIKIYCFKPDGTLKWVASAITTFETFYGPVCGVWDIDLDGIPEVMQGTAVRGLFCFSGADGSLKWTYDIGDVATAGCSADIDDDGLFEVIFGTYYEYKVIVLEHDGTLKDDYDTGNYVVAWGCVSIDDVDGDDLLEICAGSTDYYLYCLEE